jgi:alkanesulfonate monooxygenase SsuD/methylene tetrahydromethanopterin reductase-like flavin-dependent oxidoreductase (luciferase family)
MRDVLVGTTLPQFTEDPDKLLEGARRAEALGLDSIWVFDHLWPLTGGKQRPIFECWGTLAWLAAATERIGIGTLVTRSTLRHPAVLAKMAATVATIAPGRLTIAIGSGDEASRGENEAYGIPYLAGDERIAQLISTVRVVRDYLHAPAVSFDDEFASIHELPSSPEADPAPKLWVGGRSDDVLETAALVADGWNGWGGTPERFRQDAASVTEYAAERDVELSWGGLVMLDDTDAAAADRMGDRNPKGWIVGGPETVAARLDGFIEAGARHVIATFPDPGRAGVYELLAERVKPALTA